MCVVNIVGGGVVGLSVALALHGLGVEVHIFDKLALNDRLKGDGKLFFLSLRAWQFLENWIKQDVVHQAVYKVEVKGDTSAFSTLPVVYQKYDNLGNIEPMGYMVDSSALLGSLAAHFAHLSERAGNYVGACDTTSFDNIDITNACCDAAAVHVHGGDGGAAAAGDAGDAAAAGSGDGAAAGDDGGDGAAAGGDGAAAGGDGGAAAAGGGDGGAAVGGAVNRASQQHNITTGTDNACTDKHKHADNSCTDNKHKHADNACTDNVRTGSLHCHWGMGIADYYQDKDSITLVMEDGQQYKSDLCIACDGRNSLMRRKSGIKTIKHDYKNSALLGVVEHSRPHEGCTSEVFYKHGPFALLPTSDQHRSSFVLMRRNVNDLHNNADVLLAELQGMVPWGATKICGQTHVYNKLSCCIARSFVKGRLLLAGDAAHTLHPLAGQGLNLGLRDAQTIYKLLDDTMRAGLLINHHFTTQYNRLRMVDTAILGSGIHIMARVSEHPWLNKLAGYAFPVMERMKWPKNLVMDYACGKWF